MSTKLNFLIFLCSILSFASKAQMTANDSIKARYDSLRPYVDTDILIDRSPDALMLPFVDYNSLDFDGSSPANIVTGFAEDKL